MINHPREKKMSEMSGIFMARMSKKNKSSVCWPSLLTQNSVSPIPSSSVQWGVGGSCFISRCAPSSWPTSLHSTPIWLAMSWDDILRWLGSGVVHLCVWIDHGWTYWGCAWLPSSLHPFSILAVFPLSPSLLFSTQPSWSSSPPSPTHLWFCSLQIKSSSRPKCPGLLKRMPIKYQKNRMGSFYFEPMHFTSPSSSLFPLPSSLFPLPSLFHSLISLNWTRSFGVFCSSLLSSRTVIPFLSYFIENFEGVRKIKTRIRNKTNDPYNTKGTQSIIDNRKTHQEIKHNE